MTEDDPFERHIRDSRRQQQRGAARRDGQLQLFRRVWESLGKLQRNELKCGLFTLYSVVMQVTRATHGMIMLPNLGLASEFAQECSKEDEVKGNKLWQDIAGAGDCYISPEEYLTAIACWEAGEDYTPNGIDWWSHPRRPLENFWDITPPAPD